MGIDLPLLWAIIILFSIMMYVVMDGFDLGIGILYPFFQEKSERDVMMNTVAPVWDGNETWLVLGGAGMLAAFPLAYSVVLSACYLPLSFMLMGLIFRGVAFEFRFKAREHERHVWDKAFIGGSVAAAFFQGVTLGAYIQGMPVVKRSYAGGALDWLTPFSLFTGVGLVVAYALLGSTWLIMKTQGGLQARAGRITRTLVWLLLGVIAVISALDAAGRSGHRRALVCAAATVLVPARAAAGTGRGLAAAALPAARAADGAVPADPGAGLSRLQRPGHQRVAQHYPAVGIDMGGVVAAAKPGFYPGGGAVHHPRYPDVYGVVILCVSWQSPPGRWLSLMKQFEQGQQSWRKRLAWLAGIWLASVTTLGLAAWAMRLLMRAAGMGS